MIDVNRKKKKKKKVHMKQLDGLQQSFAAGCSKIQVQQDILFTIIIIIENISWQLMSNCH